MRFKTVVEELSKLRVGLEVRGERLLVYAPEGSMTDELARGVAEHKPELLRLLQRPAKVGATPMRVLRDDPTYSEVLAVLREPPGWLNRILENYRRGCAVLGRVGGKPVIWRMDLRTLANNVATALGLPPTDGARILPLVERALGALDRGEDHGSA